jgi:hypothetical protein
MNNNINVDKKDKIDTLTTVQTTHMKTRMLVQKLAMRINVTTKTQIAARARFRYNSSFST